MIGSYLFSVERHQKNQAYQQQASRQTNFIGTISMMAEVFSIRVRRTVKLVQILHQTYFKVKNINSTYLLVGQMKALFYQVA